MKCYEFFKCHHVNDCPGKESTIENNCWNIKNTFCGSYSQDVINILSDLPNLCNDCSYFITNKKKEN